MRKISNRENYIYQKLMIIFIVLIIFSYTLESIVSIGDLTIPLLLVFYCISFIYFIKFKRLYILDASDIIMYIFIVYILLQGLMFSNIKNSLIVITASIVPYFFGRFLEFNVKTYIIMKCIITLIGWVIIIILIGNFIKSNGVTRVGIDGSNVIANGELIGIFALTNLFGLNGINKNFISIFNYIVGILICLMILGSRGAAISIIITTMAILLIMNKEKIKLIFYLGATFIIYGILFRENSLLLKVFPLLNRFAINEVVKDPSIVGGAGSLGRIELYNESFKVICENPILGIGVGNLYSHNIFLEIGSSLGIVGLIIFIIWLIFILVKCKKVVNLYTVVVALFIYCLLYRQTSFSLYAHKSLFLFAAIIVSCYTLSKRNI